MKRYTVYPQFISSFEDFYNIKHNFVRDQKAYYKCMQDNNVKIITDVTVYMEYIRDKFGTIKYLSRFKNHK